MNDPVIQEKLHARGRDLPGLNFNPEIQKLKSHQNSGNTGYFIPDKWQTCNDQIVRKYLCNNLMIYSDDFRVNMLLIIEPPYNYSDRNLFLYKH
jgi:hypothetical protein